MTCVTATLSMARLLLAAVRPDLLLDLRLAAERKDEVHIDVGAGDDVGGDDLADARRPVLPRVHGRLYHRHVSADDRSHVAAPRLLVADELHLRGLHHRVGRLHHRRERAAFDHSQCFGHFDPPPYFYTRPGGIFRFSMAFVKPLARVLSVPGSPVRPRE